MFRHSLTHTVTHQCVLNAARCYLIGSHKNPAKKHLSPLTDDDKEVQTCSLACCSPRHRQSLRAIGIGSQIYGQNLTLILAFLLLLSLALKCDFLEGRQRMSH